MAKKVPEFSDQMFKKIRSSKAIGPVAEDVLRENEYRGRWVDRLCGQSPGAAQGHMKNQAKFEMLKMRAPQDDPEVAGDYYGMPGRAGRTGVRHPGSSCAEQNLV